MNAAFDPDQPDHSHYERPNSLNCRNRAQTRANNMMNKGIADITRNLCINHPCTWRVEATRGNILNFFLRFVPSHKQENIRDSYHMINHKGFSPDIGISPQVETCAL